MDLTEDTGTPVVRVPPQEIAVGCRAPDFNVQRDDGGPFQFYRNLTGRATVLLFWAGNRQALAGLAGLAAQDIEVLAIAPDEAAPVAAPELPVTFLRDSRGQVGGAYRQAAGLPADSISAFCLDGNQRVMAILSGPGGQLAEGIAAVYQKLAAWRGPPCLRDAPAPILTLPGLIDDALCDDLIDYWRRGNVFEGTVGSVAGADEFHRIYHEKKKRLDCRIEDPELHRAMELAIGRRIAPEMEKAFCFANFHFERFLVVCYDAERQDYFRPHRDNLSPDTATRRFAVTLNLSDDYDGGELVFPEYGPHKHRTHKGGAIIFSCSLIHEVLPVTRGRRYSVLNMCRQKGAEAYG